MKVAKLIFIILGILIGIAMVITGVVLASESSTVYSGDRLYAPIYNSDYYTDHLEALETINDNVNRVSVYSSYVASTIKNGISIVMGFGGLLTICVFGLKLCQLIFANDGGKRASAKEIVNTEHFNY